MDMRGRVSAHAGFTLVEIALVLVIVGLLLGGILKGQEMIVQSQIKNAMADFSGITAAFAGYQDRYRAIPGDDSGAAARWVGAVAGNGNGIVGGLYNSAAAGDESRLWWDHLRRAGFVAGNGSEQPSNAFTGMLGVQTGDGSGGAILGGFSALVLCSANMPDKVAIAIDTSMDDGVMIAGSVRGQLQSAPNPVAASASGSYAETGTNTYLVCRQL
jgi:prepilin-type N-terminal cleavage/methylation domain-containing protein